MKTTSVFIQILQCAHFLFTLSNVQTLQKYVDINNSEKQILKQNKLLAKLYVYKEKKNLHWSIYFDINFNFSIDD